MNTYNRLPDSTTAMQSLYNSAVARYKRNDPVGAADTLRNMAKAIKSDVNFYRLEATPGTIEDAIAAYSEGKIRHALKILKHLQLEMHYGKLAV